MTRFPYNYDIAEKLITIVTELRVLALVSSAYGREIYASAEIPFPEGISRNSCNSSALGTFVRPLLLPVA